MKRRNDHQVFKLSTIAALGMALACQMNQAARADQDTDPDKFTTQAITATGSFGWDEFEAAVGFAGPHDPDVVASGVGTASLGGSFTFIPMVFPLPQITGTQNSYTGEYDVDWDVSLTSLEDSNPSTTVVLQVAISDGAGGIGLDPSSILLDGVAPTSFVDRLVAPNIEHDIDNNQSVLATHFFWAEWQVAADEDYTISFSSDDHHSSLTAVRLDYYNTESVFDAAEAAPIPEPASLGLLGIGLATLGLLRRNR